MSALPSTRASNAIRWLSGDHLGEPTYPWRNDVSWRQSEASGYAHTHTSNHPERSETKDRRRPSGDTLGFCSSRIEAAKDEGFDAFHAPSAPRFRSRMS